MSIDRTIANMDARAAEIMRQRRERYLQTYCRERELVRLLYVNPLDLPNHADAVERLERAANAEERRAATGWWGYDSGRHADILAALEAERKAAGEIGRAA